MKKDAKVTAKQILEAMGGRENISSTFHCATRLRISVNDPEKIEVEAIKNADNVSGYFEKNGQHQVILGTGFVNKVHEEITKLIGGSNQEVKEEVSVKSFKDLTKVISDIFIPIIPVLLATGIIMGLQGLLSSLNIVLNEQFNTILSVLTGTAYTFIPVLVCWSSVKKFGGSPILGIVLGLMLVSPLLPDKWDVVNGVSEALHFNLGIFELNITGYQSSVVPALCLGAFAAFLEKKLNKMIPDIVQMLFVPFLTLLIKYNRISKFSCSSAMLRCIRSIFRKEIKQDDSRYSTNVICAIFNIINFSFMWIIYIRASIIICRAIFNKCSTRSFKIAIRNWWNSLCRWYSVIMFSGNASYSYTSNC